jgi:hypothetical protein
MKKIFCYAFLLILIFSFPEKGLAWGSATHAYIAKELGVGITDPLMLYGAAAPDFFYDFGSPFHSYLFNQTHHNITNIRTKSRKMDMDIFAFGFISHNEKWGADYTAHIRGRTTKKGYVITKSSLLAPKLLFHLQEALDDAGVPNSFFLAWSLSDTLAHQLVETAIDLQIKLHECPSIGLEFLNSVQSAPDTISAPFAETYSHGLSKHFKLTKEDATQIITEAEHEFRQLMVRYGEILSQEDSIALHEISEEGAVLVNGFLKNMTGKDVLIHPEVMQEFLNLASREVEADYAQEISATISYLKKKKGISSFLKTILRNR